MNWLLAKEGFDSTLAISRSHYSSFVLCRGGHLENIMPFSILKSVKSRSDPFACERILNVFGLLFGIRINLITKERMQLVRRMLNWTEHSCISANFYTPADWPWKQFHSWSSPKSTHGALTKLQYKESLCIKHVATNHIFKSCPTPANISSWSFMWCQLLWKCYCSQIMLIGVGPLDIFCFMEFVQIGTCGVTCHCDCNDVIQIEIVFLSASRQALFWKDLEISSLKNQQK